MYYAECAECIYTKYIILYTLYILQDTFYFIQYTFYIFILWKSGSMVLVSRAVLIFEEVSGRKGAKC